MLLWDEDNICTLLFNSVIYNSVALTQIVPYSSSLYTVFHSVIYNSVALIKYELKLSHNAASICLRDPVPLITKKLWQRIKRLIFLVTLYYQKLHKLHPCQWYDWRADRLKQRRNDTITEWRFDVNGSVCQLSRNFVHKMFFKHNNNSCQCLFISMGRYVNYFYGISTLGILAKLQ